MSWSRKAKVYGVLWGLAFAVLVCAVTATRQEFRSETIAESGNVRKKKPPIILKDPLFGSIQLDVLNFSKGWTTNVIVDDLYWLVGRWEVKEYRSSFSGGIFEEAKELRVYYPFVDIRLTVVLCDDPQAHPVAGVLISRRGEAILATRGAMSVGRKWMIIGGPPDGEWLLYKKEKVHGKLHIRLTTPYKENKEILLLEKVSDDPGDIRRAPRDFSAPVRLWPRWLIDYVECRYRCMARLAKEAGLEALRMIVTNQFEYIPTRFDKYGRALVE